jgi:hypothetical protein
LKRIFQRIHRASIRTLTGREQGAQKKSSLTLNTCVVARK